jgi:hypothetical protein
MEARPKSEGGERLVAGFAKRLSKSLAERLASTWVLLSDTTNFLSRTSVFEQYEDALRDMRQRLGSSKDDDRELKEIRAELTELRAALRLQGYDLSLGALDLSVKGFRNDAAIAEGFRRMVLFIAAKDIWYITGEDNHGSLHDFLEAECDKRRVSGILQKHYLWFRWSNGLLMISGADSEAVEDFTALQAWAEIPENRFLLLGRLRKAR